MGVIEIDIANVVTIMLIAWLAIAVWSFVASFFGGGEDEAAE